MEMIRRIRKEEIINLFEESLDVQISEMLPSLDSEQIQSFIKTLNFGDYMELEKYISNNNVDEKDLLQYLVSKGFKYQQQPKNNITQEAYVPPEAQSEEEIDAAQYGLFPLDGSYLQRGDQVEVKDASGNYVIGTVEANATGNGRILVRTPSGVRNYKDEDVFTDQDPSLGEDIDEELEEMKRLAGIEEESGLEEAGSCGAITSGAIAGVNMSNTDLNNNIKKLKKKKKPGPKKKRI